MTKKIFFYAFLMGALVLTICVTIFFGLQYKQNLDESYDALKGEASYAASGLQLGGIGYLKQLDNTNRITWIAHDGSVIYDSLYPTLSVNQKSYPEVRDALQNGEGHCERTSDSGGVRTMYYAFLCEDQTVLRLSRPLSILDYISMALAPVLWVFALVLLISAFMSLRVARQIIKPINSIDPDHPDSTNTYPELGFLIGRLQEQKETISRQMSELKRRQRELSVLTDNMAEGLLIIDKHRTVLSINASATAITGIDEVGKAPAFFDAQFQKVIDNALGGNRDETLLTHEGKSLRMIANPIYSHKKVSGVVVLLIDVTEREQREQLRREFSANVSHELKTPLTSISGFAELISVGYCSEQEMREFAGDIYKESQRLITLVDDILKLSKLDEDSVPAEYEAIDLYGVCQDIADSLHAAAEKKHVSLQLHGASAAVHGVWHVVYEMIYNLCDNAVKYNKTGGTVEITVNSTEDASSVTVADTGIGIPFAEQERVFERFYRVDKSHSKEIGGTGLGLSIVKHGAQLHHATVTLTSEVGKGTCVTLRFPIKN